MYLISGCLLGHNCKYSGGNNLCGDVKSFAEEHSFFAVCPETAGELPGAAAACRKAGRQSL